MARVASHTEPVPIRDDGDGLVAETTIEHNLKTAFVVRGGEVIDYTGVYPILQGSVILWSAALIGFTDETLTIDTGPHELTIVRFGPPVSGGGIV